MRADRKKGFRTPGGRILAIGVLERMALAILRIVQEMRFRSLLLIWTFAYLGIFATAGQVEGDYVDGVTMKQISEQTWRLSWPAVEQRPCEFSVSYSIFRGTKADFEPSESNRIAAGVSQTHYIVHEAKSQDYYYQVKAIKVPVSCDPPRDEPAVLRSGRVFTFPLDLGSHYTVTVGDSSDVCTASSTSELSCSRLPDFHAVIASQGSHEYLIGCRSLDYNQNNWTCVNLTSGSYAVIVHSRSLTVLDAGFSKINTESGKDLGSITPQFSILAVIK
jgi:hypothetical protein